MVLWGTIVNAIAIIAGASLGVSIRLREEIRTTIMQGLGLAVMIIGIKMGLSSINILIPIASLVIGGVIGEVLQIENRLAGLGEFLEKRFQSSTENSTFTQGFLTTSLVYCIGAMAVLGALDSGLQGTHDILYAKSMLDGVSAIFFASTFGIGVAFSAIPVFVYQGSIALLSTFLVPLFHETAIAELTATGGILIIGISINILGIKRIIIGNLLPALPVAVLLSLIF